MLVGSPTVDNVGPVLGSFTESKFLKYGVFFYYYGDLFYSHLSSKIRTLKTYSF